MKQTTRFGLILGMLAALPALAFAGGGDDKDSDGRWDKAGREQRRAAMLEKYDADGDGELGDEERAAMRHDFAIRRFESMDTNGDGSLSLAEFEAGSGRHGFRHRGRHGRSGK